MNNSVCAVVVTFNRKELLTKCISSLLDQTLKLQTIIIVDNNSTDKTEELLLQEGYIKSLPDTKQKSVQEKTIQEVKLRYIRLPENMGGAGGFYEGVKTAYEDNYDWIWIMDDDAFPTKTCLENL